MLEVYIWASSSSRLGIYKGCANLGGPGLGTTTERRRLRCSNKAGVCPQTCVGP